VRDALSIYQKRRDLKIGQHTELKRERGKKGRGYFWPLNKEKREKRKINQPQQPHTWAKLSSHTHIHTYTTRTEIKLKTKKNSSNK